jgi:hypothetical protein
MRKYSSTIPAMTLGASLAANATSATITGGASLPVIASPDVLTLVIEPDTVNEEIVTVIAHASGASAVTIVRAQETTNDILHSNGVVVKHMVTARDLQEPHLHINATNYTENGSAVLHGLGSSDGNIVGTAKAQTLTNKSINLASGNGNSITNIPQASVTDLVSNLTAKAPLASPTFTGTVVLPSTTSIGTISNAELLKLDGLTASTDELNRVTGVTSPIQTQIDSKQTQIDGKLTIPGAWTSYTPTIGGGWTAGNSTVTAAYQQIGKTVHVRVSVAWGTTYTSSGTNSPTFTLPVTAATSNASQSGILFCEDGTTRYMSAIVITSTTVATGYRMITSSAGGLGPITATTPFTWSTGDAIRFNLTYEAA